MGTQNGSNLEVRPEGIFDSCLRIKVVPLECFLVQGSHAFAKFSPTHCVSGHGTHTYKHDNHYPICSKLQYREPVCIVWFYSAHSYTVLSFSVCSTAKLGKRPGDCSMHLRRGFCTVVLHLKPVTNWFGLCSYTNCSL